MTLNPGELLSGGYVRDTDGRIVVAVDPSSSVITAGSYPKILVEQNGIHTTNSGAQNTAAAQTLTSSLSATGAALLFGQGEYDFDCTSGSPFTFTAGGARGAYVLEGMAGGLGQAGEGPGTRLLRSAGTNPLVTNTNAAAFRRSRIDFRFIELHGGSTSGDVVVIASLSDALWLDSRITDATGRLVYLTEAYNNRFVGVDFLRGGNGTATPATMFDGRVADSGQSGGGGSVVNHFTACEWEGHTGSDIMVDGDGTNSSALFLFSNCKAERSVLGASYPVLDLRAVDRVFWAGGSIHAGGAQAILTSTTSTTVNPTQAVLGAAAPVGVTVGMTVASSAFAYGTTITTISGDRLTLTMSNSATQSSASTILVINGATSRLVQTTAATGTIGIFGSVLQQDGNTDYLIDMVGGRLQLGCVNMSTPNGNPPNFWVHLGTAIPADGYQAAAMFYQGNAINAVLDNRTAVSLAASQFIERIPIDGSSGSATRATVGSFQAWQMPHAATSTLHAAQTITDRFADGVTQYIVRVKFSAPSTGGNVRLQLQVLTTFGSTDVTGAATQTLLSTVAVGGTANKEVVATFTVTGAAGWAPGNQMKYAFSRLGSDAADTFTGVINISVVEILGTPRR